MRAVAMLAIALVGLSGTAQRPPQERRASGQIEAASWPYFPGSVVPIRVDGFPIPYHLSLVGPGTLLAGGSYAIAGETPPNSALLVAGNATGLAARNFRIGTPPMPDRPTLAVVSYDDGLIFHDARNFDVVGVLATAGAPSDAAIDRSGRIAMPDTQGSTLTIATLAPWTVKHVDGVPLGDEVVFDESTHAVLVTNRDVNGKGALTRVLTDGTVSSVVTGQTAEGVAVDERRQIVYVANVNDGTIAIVDARSMVLKKRFKAVSRVFSLALSPDGTMLYGISNQSAGSPFAAPGSAVAIDLRGNDAHVVARSANLAFPIGAALDSAGNTLFVTDESADQIDVLSVPSMRAKRPPVSTCHTPWKPAFDAQTHRLYVPCARADRVDVFDTRTMKRVASFETGGYPLAVMVWHGRPPAKR